jgi:preprotein translocase SecF subunit
MLSFFPRVPNIKFISVRYLAYLFSLLVILLGTVSFVKRGEKNFGIDFTGGLLQEYEFRTEVSTNQIREVLKKIELGDSLIQRVKGSSRFIVRTYGGKTEDVLQSLREKFGEENVLLLRVEKVGAMVGKDLRRKAIKAVSFSLLAMCLYISLRFRFKFAIAAIIALIHDVLVSAGALSFSGREFSLPVIAALLTIVGYSINDTIVVFDRIRENMRLKKVKLKELINLSINQTLSRTILTSLTTLFTVFSLFLFGGEVINPFAFVLLIGVMVGPYSSIFVASPVIFDWMKEERF